MSTVKMYYGNYRFLPAPLMNKSVVYSHDINKNLMSAEHTYTLTGYLLYIAGDFNETMALRQELETALASGNQQFRIDYNDIPIMSGYPVVNNVNFDEGVWVDKIPYSIELYEKVSTAISSGIESYNESWNFTEDENFKTVTVEHTFSAQGVDTTDGVGDNALENAKNYVIANIGYSNAPSFLPAFCQGSGTLIAYGAHRTENANTSDGLYEVTEVFTLSSGAYIHTTNSNFEYDDGGNITVTVEGNIQGLGRGSVRFTNALTGWDDIKTNIINTASGVYIRYGGKLELPTNPNSHSIAENADTGTIDYSYSYNDDIVILPSGITEFEITKDIVEPVSLYASHTIVNKTDGPVVQDLGTSSEGSVTVAGRAVKKTEYPLADLKDYISTRIEALSTVGYGSSYRVSQKSYSIDETGNVIEFSIEWTFTGPAYSTYLTYI